MIEACIFDLDGVIVDTAKYHFLAWQKLAQELGITFTEVDNEEMKGISRRASLEALLKLGNKKYPEEVKEKFLISKNEDYLSFVEEMDRSEILPGVRKFLSLLRKQQKKIALGSASKNARKILTKINLTSQFDAIVDGNDVIRAKPDPEVFLNGAKLLNVQPDKTVVFEDSAKGIDAALRGGFIAVGVGAPLYLGHAHDVIASFENMDNNFLDQLYNSLHL